MRGGGLAMAKRKEITIILSVEMGDGSVRPWDDLSHEEVETVKEHMRSRLSTAMSAYYTQHLDEFERMK